jgi:hypothetical protein
MSRQGGEVIVATSYGHQPLRQGLVTRAALVVGAVREQIVDDHADNGEEEDDEAPDELLGGRAARL